VYYRMGLLEAQRGNFAQAYDMLTLATQFRPDKREAAIALGDLAWSIYTADDRPAARLYNDLSKISEKLLAANARDFDGLRFKAYIAVADKRIEDAVRLFQEANALRALQPEVVMPLAQLLIEKEQIPAAEKLLRQLVAAKPSHGPAYSALYTIYTGRNVLRKRRGCCESALRRIQEIPPP
jgi:predicted Zn-dependent protease